MKRLQRIVIRSEALRSLAQRTGQLGRLHAWCDASNHSCHNVVLYLEQLIRRALRGITPQADAKLHVMQLHRYAHAV